MTFKYQVPDMLQLFMRILHITKMDYLPEETLCEVVQYLSPQQNLNSLACVSSCLRDSLYSIQEKNQYKDGKGLFARTALLTPFQCSCLKELEDCRHTSVPDVDNGYAVVRALVWKLLRCSSATITVSFMQVPVETLFQEDFGKYLVTQVIQGPIGIQGFIGPGIQAKTKSADCEVLFCASEPPPVPEGVTRYVVYVSDFTHPVEEYTNLHVHESTYASYSSMPFLRCLHVKKLDLGNVLCIEKDVVTDDYTVPDFCYQYHGHLSENAVRMPCNDKQSKNASYKSVTALPYEKTIRYADIANYDTVVCEKNKYCVRIASLLMQFSTKPKRLILYSGTSGLGTAYPFPAKLRYHYLMECFGEEPKNLHGLYGSTYIIGNYAEMCVLACGADPTKSLNWVAARAGKCTALKEEQGTVLIQHYHLKYEGWLELKPGASWTDLTYPDEAIKKQKVVKQTPVVDIDDNLREKVEYSLTTKRGRSDGSSLTLDEAKALCKQLHLPVSGTRQQVLERILENL